MSVHNYSLLCWVVCVKMFFTCLVLYYPGGLLHRFHFPEMFYDVLHFAGFSLKKCTFYILHSCVCRGTTSNCPAKNCFLKYWVDSRACASAWLTHPVEYVSSNEEVTVSWLVELFVSQVDVRGNLPAACVQPCRWCGTSNVRQYSTVKCGVPICVWILNY